MKFVTRKLIGKISLGVLFFFLAVFITSIVFIVFIYSGGFGKLPGDEALISIKNPQASEVYSADSVLMGRYYLQNRLDLNEDELTPIIKNSLLATEDIRFFEHKGIDFRSLFRVFFKTILLDKVSSGGGSTITQQLAKNLFPRENHRFLSLTVNKIKEMMIAVRIENLYTKEEILDLYLNTIQFGEDTYGLKTASILFFNKNPASLNIEEAALLVGMLKATSYYNPRKYPERALARRNVVLSQLQQYEYLDEETADSLQSLPVTLNYSSLPFYAGIAPYFREYLRQELDEWCTNNEKENGENFNLYTDGLKIYTSIHSKMQLYAEQSVREHMSSLQKLFDLEWKNRDIWNELKEAENNYLLARPGNDDTTGRKMTVFDYEGEEERHMNLSDSIKYFMNFLQTGFMAMDVETAEIKAWVGGIDFKFFKYDHVLSERQAGSVFKPILYLAALEEGINPCDFYPNDSIVYEDYDNWSPRNADREYGGSYSMKGALAHSVNTVSAALIMETGIKKVVDLAHLAGINADIPDVPSISLGTASVSLFELLKFYHILASKGMKKETVYLKKITDRQGKLLYNSDLNDQSTRIFSAKDVEILTAMLLNVVNNGTAASLRYKYGLTGDIAGKTGTTQNHSDGWFIGYTPKIAAGVWVGGELPGIRFRSARQGQGAFSAMPVFALFMQKLYTDPEFAYLKSETFNISDDVKELLECEDFREQEPFRELIKNKLKRFWFFRKRE